MLKALINCLMVSKGALEVALVIKLTLSGIRNIHKKEQVLIWGV